MPAEDEEEEEEDRKLSTERHFSHGDRGLAGPPAVVGVHGHGSFCPPTPSRAIRHVPMLVGMTYFFNFEAGRLLSQMTAMVRR